MSVQLCVAGDQRYNSLGLLSRAKVDACPMVCVAGDQEKSRVQGVDLVLPGCLFFLPSLP